MLCAEALGHDADELNELLVDTANPPQDTSEGTITRGFRTAQTMNAWPYTAHEWHRSAMPRLKPWA
ncbi:hypothetical protein GCM10027569_34380 [Flindersiella endophytica]